MNADGNDVGTDKVSAKLFESRRPSGVWAGRLGPGESRIPKLQSSTDSTSAGGRSPCRKDVTPPSVKSSFRVRFAADDAAAVSQKLFTKDISPLKSPRVHDLIHVHEERIHSIQQAAAAEKHHIQPHHPHKSRLALHGCDQAQQQAAGHLTDKQHPQQHQQQAACPDLQKPTPSHQQNGRQHKAAQQDQQISARRHQQHEVKLQMQLLPQQTSALRIQQVAAPVPQLQLQQLEPAPLQQQPEQKAQQQQQQAHQQQQATLDKQLASAETEVTLLLQHLEDALAAQSTAECDLASSKSELTSLMAEAMQLKQQVAQAEQFSSTAATTVMQLQQELEEAHIANEELVTEMMKLRRQLETHSADTALAVSKAEVVLLQQQLQEARRGKQAAEAAVEEMEQQLAAAAEDVAAAAAYREQVSRLQQQLTDAQQCNQAATAAVADLQQRLTAAEGAAATLNDCQMELQRYKQQFAAADARAADAEGTAVQLQQQLQDVFNKLSTANAEVQQLQQKAVQAEQDSLAGSAMLLQLQQQLDEADSAGASLAQQVQDLQQQVADSQQQRDAAVVHNSELQQQLQEAIASKDALTTACSEAEAKAHQLQQRVEAAEAAKHAAATTVVQLTEQLAKAETRVHDLEPKLQASMQDAEASKQRVQQLERKVEWGQHNKREKKSMQMDSQLKQLQFQLKVTQDAHAAAKQQLHDAEQQIQLLRQQQQQKAGRVSWGVMGQDWMSSRDWKDHAVQPDFQDRCMKLQSEGSDSRAVVDLLREELVRCRAELQQAKVSLAWAEKHKVQHLFGFGRVRKSVGGSDLQHLGPTSSNNGGVGSGGVHGRLFVGDLATDAEAMRSPEPIRCQSRLGGIKGLRTSNNGLRTSNNGGLRSSHNGGLRVSHNGGLAGDKSVRVLDVSGHPGSLRISTRYQASDWPSACSSPVSGLS